MGIVVICSLIPLFISNGLNTSRYPPLVLSMNMA